MEESPGEQYINLMKNARPPLPRGGVKKRPNAINWVLLATCAIDKQCLNQHPRGIKAFLVQRGSLQGVAKCYD